MSETASGQDESGTTPPAAPEAVAELKAELEKARNDYARLEGRLDQLSQSSQRERAPAPPPQLTGEQYGELLKSNPHEAIKLAVKDVVREQVAPLVQNVETKSEKRRWDEKVEGDFPALRTDREFKTAVKEQMQEMIEVDGISPEHPTLLYRAAQIASTKLGRGQAQKTRDGISGEAPSSGGRNDGGKKFVLPEHFKAFSQVFGMSEESQKRLAAKMETKAKTPERRSR